MVSLAHYAGLCGVASLCNVHRGHFWFAYGPWMGPMEMCSFLIGV